MALFLSTVLTVLALTETTFGLHSGWLQATFRSCDPCECNNPCNTVALPHCRAVGTAGSVATLECFSDAQLSPSPVSHSAICGKGAGNPVATTVTGVALTCNANSDCPTDFVCYKYRSWWSTTRNICCKDLRTCVKTGDCPSTAHTPQCHWRSRICNSDADCYSLQKCCGPYTGISGCLANTKYCQNAHFTFAGK